MRNLLLAGCILATAGAAPALADAAEVYFKDAAMEVTIIPEARRDFAAVVTRPNAQMPTIRVYQSPQGIVVDGGLGKRLRSCGGTGGFRIKDGPRINRRDLPQVVVRAPLDFAIRTDGYVRGSVGRARALNISTEGCGDWTLADTTSLQVSLQGLGDIRAGRTGAARIDMEGLGDVDVASVSGPVDASVDGMGSLRIKGGQASRFKAQLSGMGSIRFDGVAGSVDASADGMGTIRVARATGPVRKSASGFSHVKVGD